MLPYWSLEQVWAIDQVLTQKNVNDKSRDTFALVGWVRAQEAEESGFLLLMNLDEERREKERYEKLYTERDSECKEIERQLREEKRNSERSFLEGIQLGLSRGRLEATVRAFRDQHGLMEKTRPLRLESLNKEKRDWKPPSSVSFLGTIFKSKLSYGEWWNRLPPTDGSFTENILTQVPRRSNEQTFSLQKTEAQEIQQDNWEYFNSYWERHLQWVRQRQALHDPLLA